MSTVVSISILLGLVDVVCVPNYVLHAVMVINMMMMTITTYGYHRTTFVHRGLLTHVSDMRFGPGTLWSTV